jgi:hypothetical protein
MDHDHAKVDEIVLALLFLAISEEDAGGAQGYLSDPKSKAKSVVLSPEGVSRARELLERHFGRKNQVCHQRRRPT